MAQKTGKQRHIHKYARGRNGLWYCAFDDCTHFMPHNVADQVEGKSSKCWECGRVFLMSATLMELDRPKCTECTTGMDADVFEQYFQEKLKKATEDKPESEET